MVLLLFSALINLLSLALFCFIKSKFVKVLSVFGCFFCITILFLWGYVSRPCFSASTPMDISFKNVTGEKLSLYSVIFWDNSWNGINNYVAFDDQIRPQQTSDFCFETDGMSEFWIVAKNEHDEVRYLKEFISEPAGTVHVKSNLPGDMHPGKARLARQLTMENDIIRQREDTLLYTNIGLLLLLIVCICRTKATGSDAKFGTA